MLKLEHPGNYDVTHVIFLHTKFSIDHRTVIICLLRVFFTNKLEIVIMLLSGALWVSSSSNEYDIEENIVSA